MKQLQIFGSVLMLMMALWGCESDPCKGVVCSEPRGTCVDGSCICETGYEGSDCSITSTDKFLGIYQGSVDSTGLCYLAPDDHTVSITASPIFINRIILSNFANLGCDVEATVLGDELEIVSDKTYCPNSPNADNGYRFEGLGSIVDSTITVEYIVTYDFFGSEVELRCTEVLEK